VLYLAAIMFRRLSRPLSASAALGAVAYIHRRRDDALCRRDDPLADFSVGAVLGEGAYAVVKLVTSNLTGERFALKVIDKAFTLQDAMEKELAVLRAIGRHRHVVSMVDAFELPALNAYGVVLELASGGEVFDRICDRGAYSERDAAALVRQVAQALQHMHAAHVVHRDLKPENLLLVDSSDEAPVKVADFGLSDFFGDGRPPLTASVGTVAYMAPEVVACAEYGSAVDLWSLGVVLYILLAGYHPFDPHGTADDKALLRNIRAGRWDFGDACWSEVSDDAKRVVTALLARAPAQRPTAELLLAMEWVQGDTAPDASLAASAESLKRFNEARRVWRAAAAAAALVARAKPGEAAAAAPTGGDGGGGGGDGGGGGGAAGLSAEAIEELRVAFGAFDRDGSGVIEADELRVAMQRMEMGAADAAAAMRRVDADADGAITFGEFCNAMAPVYSSNRQMLRRAFDTFDADGSGFIDRQELASMLSKLGIAPASEQLLEAVFRAADTNGDGKVSYDEFVAMLGKELHTPPPVRGS